MKPIVKKRRLYMEVVQSILSYIEKKDMQPGDQLLSERALASLLCVSRTTVKEAISVLESNGIVHVQQGVGTFLSASSKELLKKEANELFINEQDRFLELIELRQAIEGDTAYYAAKRMTPAQEEKLTSCYNELYLAEKAQEAGIEEDLRFHLAVAAAANNLLMSEMMQLISHRMKIFLIQNRHVTLEETEQVEKVMEEHKEIYEAIIQRNPDKAKRAMWNHLHSIKIRHMYEWGD